MELLYTDDEIVVAVKPVGLDSEQEFPQELKTALGGEIYPLHRLDKNVGGVMVYARTRPTAARISREIQQGNMVKEYVVLVHGQPPESGEWKDFLFKDSRTNRVFVTNRLRKGVKEAGLSFVRLRSGERSLMRIQLQTGRSHQIRVQFSSRGFPLVGDHKYGSRAEETAPMLYSCRLSFWHKGQMQTFESLPPWADG